ncbi:MAG: transcription repressor NadR [Acetatifactor sp.]|nr:transcription repressor NadR [Acetatifactor sp.]
MTLDGNARRTAILVYLQRQTGPVSGTELAKQFGVSRKVIVKDIALLRADNRNILSTNKGYVLYHPQEKHSGYTAVITVNHTPEQALEEMLSIVEYGGSMLDVFIDHDLYGQIRANLVINEADDANEFCQKLSQSNTVPLKEFTEGCHYHTISAPSERTLDLIRKELQEKGILVED